jgi:hypothetical protein
MTYTLFTQSAQVGQSGLDATGNAGPYTLGTEFEVSQSATATAIWFYSPVNASDLPQQVGIYAGTSLLYSQASSWSGAAASGWVKTTLSSPPSLSPGTKYKVVVLHTSGNAWYPLTANYWSSGAGGSGITNGILSAPGSSTAEDFQFSYIAGTSFAYPTTGYQDSNVWVDVEVANATVSGTAAVTLKKTTVAVSAGGTTSGTAIITLKKMTVTVAGGLGTFATVDTTYKKMSVLITSTIKDASILDLMLKKMVVSATGAVLGQGVTGTVDITLRKQAVAITGLATSQGGGSVPITDSILDSVKKFVGLSPSDLSFDLDVVLAINGAFGALKQLGVGSDTGFIIADNTTLWSQYVSDLAYLGMIKMYVIMAVKLAFDPPATSFGIAAVQEQIQQLAWRINIEAEHINPPSDPFGMVDPLFEGGDLKTAFSPKVVNLVYSSVITPDATAGNVFYLTLQGNAVINAPVGGHDGQHITLELSSAGYNVVWGSGWNFGDPGTPTLSTDGKADIISAYYKETAAQWRAGFTPGF